MFTASEFLDDIMEAEVLPLTFISARFDAAAVVVVDNADDDDIEIGGRFDRLTVVPELPITLSPLVRCSLLVVANEVGYAA